MVDALPMFGQRATPPVCATADEAAGATSAQPTRADVKRDMVTSKAWTSRLVEGRHEDPVPAPQGRPIGHIVRALSPLETVTDVTISWSDVSAAYGQVAG